MAMAMAMAMAAEKMNKSEISDSETGAAGELQETSVLSKDIRFLKGVGEKKAELYSKLGVSTVGELLQFYPRAYIDFSSPAKIDETNLFEVNTIRATVYKKMPAQRIKKGMTVFKIYVTDDVSNLCITIFNNKYLYDKLELYKSYILYGKITGNFLRREMNSPIVIDADSEDVIRPVYRQTEGLTSNAVAINVKAALDSAAGGVYDPLPPDILRENSLCHYTFALRNIHFPKNSDALAQAKKRLVFEELLTLQLGLSQLKTKNRHETPVVFKDHELSEFYRALPFKLTGAQLRAIGDCVADTSKNVPMNRLIQGDVGSGKTMVAAAMSFLAAKNGYQTAFMAPTEILAAQHYKTLSKLFKNTGISVGLLTGSETAAQKKQAREQIALGQTDIAVGTHALVQSSVAFKNLGLVITDEQHRFGVAQRGRLAEKGNCPHTLVMSATPIPRTLALIIYGDLDVSFIDELPAGRQKIQTLVISGKKRERALKFITDAIKNGRQAYIVCPLIEENESDLSDVTSYYNSLKKGQFKNIKTGLLHGKLSAAEKNKIMSEFKDGSLGLIVSTTVIEVGVDVPNATVMMIENAERFGLSQLHQLRGRVGRGSEQSYCILLSDNRSGDVNSRLKTMAETSDGFKIAKEDLKLRGPGDFFGERQHGLPKLKIADMADDISVLKTVQEIASEILKSDPELSQTEHRGLALLVSQLFGAAGELSGNSGGFN